MTLDSRPSRRHVLQILAGGAAAAAGANPVVANPLVAKQLVTKQARIERLILAAHALPAISQRIGFISSALIDTRYRGHTLIGGPRQPEKFVVRDDAFDCVTFCEIALAAAIAPEPGAFEPALRALRYRNGVIDWRERNHYFFEWGEHNIANGSCRAIDLAGAVDIKKTVYWHPALGRRHFAMRVVPRAVFLANKDKLATGDIIGFVTRRPGLDYFHVGFAAFGRGGEFLLRHASRSHGRVVDERMAAFVAVNRVRYVTLLRPLDTAAAVA